MTLYQRVAEVGTRYFGKAPTFKYGFNLSPMYRSSSAKILLVSDDLLHIRVKLPITYKNRNFVGSIFGGSMFSAVDPIPMVQLMNLLGDDYVVWDKAAEISFLRPARTDLYADFSFSTDELEEIKNKVATGNEYEIVKTTFLSDEENTIYCRVKKTIYIADKRYFKEKRKCTKN